MIIISYSRAVRCISRDKYVPRARLPSPRGQGVRPRKCWCQLCALVSRRGVRRQPVSGGLLRGANGPSLRQTSEFAGSRFRRAKAGPLYGWDASCLSLLLTLHTRRELQRAKLANGRIPARSGHLLRSPLFILSITPSSSPPSITI